MNNFNVFSLPLPGLRLVCRKQLGDQRGFLSRLFCFEELASIGWSKPIAQINHTYTAKQGTVRGLHFQRPPHSEMKLVTCIRGKIWDVAVDIRLHSPSFLKWHAEYLSVDNGNSLLIPEGFAHGFQAMTDDVEIIYCHSAAYYPDAEAGLNVQDPILAIDWKKTITELSERDKNNPFIETDFKGVLL
jgi:dTDP-4-dehydrorhamnose 3,5-epimerase